MANKKKYEEKRIERKKMDKGEDQQEWYKRDISLHQDQLKPEMA